MVQKHLQITFKQVKTRGAQDYTKEKNQYPILTAEGAARHTDLAEELRMVVGHKEVEGNLTMSARVSPSATSSVQLTTWWWSTILTWRRAVGRLICHLVFRVGVFPVLIQSAKVNEWEG